MLDKGEGEVKIWGWETQVQEDLLFSDISGESLSWDDNDYTELSWED